MVNYDSDCKACFDNLLSALLGLKKNNLINEFLYKPFSLIVLDSNTDKEILIDLVNKELPVEHKFAKFEVISEPEYEEYKKTFVAYTKSLFGK